MKKMLWIEAVRQLSQDLEEPSLWKFVLEEIYTDLQNYNG